MLASASCGRCAPAQPASCDDEGLSEVAFARHVDLVTKCFDDDGHGLVVGDPGDGGIHHMVRVAATEPAEPRDHPQVLAGGVLVRQRGVLSGDRHTIAEELAARFDMQRPSVAEHLRALREAGLVEVDRRGRERIYHLAPQPLREVSDWLQPYERFWRNSLKDLRAHLDAEDLP